MKDYYTKLSQERFDEIMIAYKKFTSKLTDVNAEPIRVYKPLSQKSMEDIQMIREMSKELQKKKDEDMRKAAEAADEAAKAQQEKTAEKSEPEEASEPEKESDPKQEN